MFLPRLPIFAVLLAIPGFTKTIPAVCGTSPTTHLEVADFHSRSLKKQTKVRSAVAVRTLAQDVGDLVIMDDTDGVVARRNPFNLSQKKVVFSPETPDSKTYRFIGPAASDFSDEDSVQATPLTGLGDDDSVAVSLPFSFPFFGARYNSMFVNSDGNLTFTVGDSASMERSLGRLVAGPPRIALIFGDLDPSKVTNSVRVRKFANSVVITWQGVPEYEDNGRGAQQTAQVRLFSDGRIEMVWQAISMSAVVVGIAPGNLQGNASLVDFSAGRSGQYSAAVAERFGNTESLDLLAAAQKFYQTHEDAYDFLAFYNTGGISPGPGVLAFSSPVRDVALGNGAPLVGDVGGEYGSPNRLKAVLNMGPTTQYPLNPNSRVPLRFDAGDTPLTVLGHEAGHLFLAYASIRDPQTGAQPMLGRSLFHWSFFFNSEASLLEGNRIQDNGEVSSPRFLTTATVEGYSPLDQYLMGLRPAQEVPPTFVVLNSTLPSIGGAGAPPSIGVRFNGTRKDVRVEDIIAEQGQRIPDYTITQRRFRFALILVYPAGSPPAAETIAQIENLRSQFESAFTKFTGERAVADTKLARNLRLNLEPYSGIVAGNTVMASVELDASTPKATEVKLSQFNGLLSIPQSVVIAAGSRRAQFPVTGVRAGVELLTASIGAGYVTSEARVAVSGSSSQLRLAVVAGDEQAATDGLELTAPVVVRLRDAAGAPFPGQLVRAQPDAGGKVTPVEAITDANGEASFRWVTAKAAGRELVMQLGSAPQVVARVVALAKPAFGGSGIVNAASFVPGLTPGGIATIFGTNLERSQVSVNQRPATVFYSSAGQINFVTPVLSDATASVVVSNKIANSAPVQANLIAVQPGIFFDAGTGLGAVISRGKGIFEVYCTGLGASAASVSARIGNQPADVLYSGQAPSFLGLYQVNLQTNVPPGEYMLQLTAAGQLSNTVKILVSE